MDVAASRDCSRNDVVVTPYHHHEWKFDAVHHLFLGFPSRHHYLQDAKGQDAADLDLSDPAHCPALHVGILASQARVVSRMEKLAVLRLDGAGHRCPGMAYNPPEQPSRQQRKAGSRIAHADRHRHRCLRTHLVEKLLVELVRI